MPTFTVTGDIDPFLHVRLQRGESVFCESDAMVMMEDTLDLRARIQGGLLQATFRRLANGESFFQQQITAKRGSGDCLLAPKLPGALQVLDVGAEQYCIADDAYVAATDGVDVVAQLQSVGGALFGQKGGFFIGRSSGQGQIVVSGFGALCTRRGSGLLGNLVNSVVSGEGIVLKFSGQGKVIICSRNRNSFVSWLGEKINGKH